MSTNGTNVIPTPRDYDDDDECDSIPFNCFEWSDLRQGVPKYVIYLVVALVGITANTVEIRVFFSKAMRSRSSIMLGVNSVLSLVYLTFEVLRCLVKELNRSWEYGFYERLYELNVTNTFENCTKSTPDANKCFGQLYFNELYNTLCFSSSRTVVLFFTVLLSSAETASGLVLAWICIDRLLMLYRSSVVQSSSMLADATFTTVISFYSYLLIVLLNGFQYWPDLPFRLFYGRIIYAIGFYASTGVCVVVCTFLSVRKLRRGDPRLINSTGRGNVVAQKVVYLLGLLYLLLNVIPGISYTVYLILQDRYIWSEGVYSPFPRLWDLETIMVVVRLFGMASPDSVVYFVYNRNFRTFVKRTFGMREAHPLRTQANSIRTTATAINQTATVASATDGPNEVEVEIALMSSAPDRQ